MNPNGIIRLTAVSLLVCAIGIGAMVSDAVASGRGSSRSLADRLRYGPGLVNHPVGVVPSSLVRIPEGWPLELDGTIGCRTCHTSLPAQGSGVANLRNFDEWTAETNHFCSNCHSARPQSLSSAPHWMAIDAAHVQDDGVAERANGLLDAQSRRCMECHDGVSAPAADNSTPLNPSQASHGDHRRNHPVGVSFPRGLVGKSSTRFRPMRSIPEHVRLPSGKVGCISCHDLYSNRNGLLTVPVDGSALCLTCHDMA